MKMKTNELTGRALNWAVGICEGYKPETFCPHDKHFRDEDNVWYSPSDDWSPGGPIIERELICIERCIRACEYHGWRALKDYSFEASVPEETTWGETPLIAAMRCYVMSQYGDEIEIPDELKGE